VDQEGDAGTSGKGVMDLDKPQFSGRGALVDVGQVVLVCWVVSAVSAVSSRAVKWLGVTGQTPQSLRHPTHKNCGDPKPGIICVVWCGVELVLVTPALPVTSSA
jgi:hypothetical protein